MKQFLFFSVKDIELYSYETKCGRNSLNTAANHITLDSGYVKYFGWNSNNVIFKGKKFNKGTILNNTFLCVMYPSIVKT